MLVFFFNFIAYIKWWCWLEYFFSAKCCIIKAIEKVFLSLNNIFFKVKVSFASQIYERKAKRKHKNHLLTSVRLAVSPRMCKWIHLRVNNKLEFSKEVHIKTDQAIYSKAEKVCEQKKQGTYKKKKFLNVNSGSNSRAGGEKPRSTKGWWTFDRCWYQISYHCILSVEHWLLLNCFVRLFFFSFGFPLFIFIIIKSYFISTANTPLYLFYLNIIIRIVDVHLYLYINSWCCAQTIQMTQKQNPDK